MLAGKPATRRPARGVRREIGEGAAMTPVGPAWRGPPPSSRTDLMQWLVH